MLLSIPSISQVGSFLDTLDSVEWTIYSFIALNMFMYSMVMFGNITKSISLGIGVVFFCILLDFLTGYSLSHDLKQLIYPLVANSHNNVKVAVFIISTFSGLYFGSRVEIKGFKNSKIMYMMKFLSIWSSSFVILFIIYAGSNLTNNQ